MYLSPISLDRNVRIDQHSPKTFQSNGNAEAQKKLDQWIKEGKCKLKNSQEILWPILDPSRIKKT